MASDRDWFVVSRWQEYAGEARANLLRACGIAAFYIVELINYYGVKLGGIDWPSTVDRPFHVKVTALAVAWTLLALATQLCLQNRLFSTALKYVTTACDIILLTMILCVADGPRSPLVVGYFLIVALSALRFQLRLMWFATLGSMAGYLALLGYAKWYAGVREVSVPRSSQLIFLLALALTGIILGQVVRQVRALSSEYSRRTASRSGGADK